MIGSAWEQPPVYLCKRLLGFAFYGFYPLALTLLVPLEKDTMSKKVVIGFLLK